MKKIYSNKIRFSLIIILIFFLIFNSAIYFLTETRINIPLLHETCIILISFLLFRPEKIIIKQSWKFMVVSFIMSLIGENLGTFMGLWHFSREGILLPVPFLVNISYSIGTLSLLWYYSWTKKKDEKLRKRIYYSSLLIFSLIGTVADWISPEWITGPNMHPLVTFLVWLGGMIILTIFSKKLLKKRLGN